MPRWEKFLVGGLALLAAAALAAGQAPAPVASAPQSPKPPGAAQPGRESAKKPDSDSGIDTDNPKRIFGIIPNSKTVNDLGGPVFPLTPRGKFRLVRDYFVPFTLLGSAFGAGIGQATNSESGYGQGLEGYGKRVGAGLADGLTGEFFVTGVFPSLLHEDPRYFRRGYGNTSSRMLYAATRVVVTRKDSGQRTFNFSQPLGALASSGIANSYYPRDEREWDDVISRAGFQISGNALDFVLKEFAPDIMRKLKRKKRAPAVGIPPETPAKN